MLESWALKNEQVQTGSIPSWLSPRCAGDDVGCSRETDYNEHVEEWFKVTHDEHVDGNAKKDPDGSQTQHQ
jgi:hypothetical protein